MMNGVSVMAAANPAAVKANNGDSPNASWTSLEAELVFHSALTPALSQRERENHRQHIRNQSALALPTDWVPFSLSLRERAGVRAVSAVHANLSAFEARSRI